MELTVGETPSSRDWANRCVTRRDLFRLSTHAHTKGSALLNEKRRENNNNIGREGERKVWILMMDRICFVDSGLLGNHRNDERIFHSFSDSIWKLSKEIQSARIIKIKNKDKHLKIKWATREGAFLKKFYFWREREGRTPPSGHFF